MKGGDTLWRVEIQYEGWSYSMKGGAIVMIRVCKSHISL